MYNNNNKNDVDSSPNTKQLNNCYVKESQSIL